MALGHDEIMSILHRRATMVVATIGSEGQPHAVPVAYGVQDKVPFFTTPASSQKVKDLRRSPRIACVIDGHPGDITKVGGVELLGVGEIVEGQRDVAALYDVLRFQQMSSGEGVTLPDHWDRERWAKGRVGVRIIIERIISWP